MKKLATANWFVALAGTLAYLGTTLFCFSMAKFSAVPAANGLEASPVHAGESWIFLNPELDQMVAELKQEKESLSMREQQLKELEARLASERQEINIVTEAVARVQRDLDRTLVRIKQEDVPNLKKLAKMHASMSPEGSANILKEHPDDEILKIFFYLKPTESGPILEAFGKLGKADAQRAAQLTERLRRTTETPAGKVKR
ncbi:MAG TPA: hypothetical protein VK530_16215 [Candidatus Acidoferrum sp.]|nr:hypothetical protein [Candidatus Acidoferrum sp.]